MALILVALSLAYGIPILLFALGHARIRQKVVSGTLPELTVLVAARNESEHIEACLRAILAQDVPVHVLVVDDHSEDDTARRVEAFGERVRLIRLKEGSGKKAAITEAVRHIRTEWVLLTDADTLVPPGWARAMAATMRADCGYVVGPVRLQERRGLFHRMIQLEWAGFMGIARGSIGLGRPTSACGSSVAFRIEAFRAVGGYEGVDHFASGDDEFLMQRVADRGFAEELAAQRLAARLLASPMTSGKKDLMLAWGSFDSGRDSTAMAQFSALVESRQETSHVRAEATYGVARVFHVMGETSEAIAWYERTLDEAADPLAKWHGFARMHLVELYLDSGHEQRALSTLRDLHAMEEAYDYRSSVENRVRFLITE